jgi:hypothetical protein
MPLESRSSKLKPVPPLTLPQHYVVAAHLHQLSAEVVDAIARQGLMNPAHTLPAPSPLGPVPAHQVSTKVFEAIRAAAAAPEFSRREAFAAVCGATDKMGDMKLKVCVCGGGVFCMFGVC